MFIDLVAERGAGALWSTLPLILPLKSKHGRSAPNRPKGKGVQVSISTATFVPKPFTPFEFEPQATREEIMHKQQVLMDSISSKKLRQAGMIRLQVF